MSENHQKSSDTSEVWVVRRSDGVTLKFTTASIKRSVKPKKYKPGSEQYQLAWRISHNIKEYDDALRVGQKSETTRAQILEELTRLVELETRPADSRRV